MITPNTLLQNRYLVIEQIGHGGMGAVYKATDQRFGSTVALKETFFDDPSLRKAFEREAHLLNRLRHPALPRVSDHFNENEGQFLVMEFIEGEDLSEMLEKRGAAFPLEQVLVWADQLLDALDYLHTQETPVIHRDIKPQNLKLASRNQIILLDFGLAKGTPVAISRASVTGSVFGYSRNYAPLEQMQGTGTDTRSDIYSLAATLYHLLTGAIPPDALTRAMSIVNGHEDPLKDASEVHSQVTESVSAVISKAMAQSAARRYQTAEEMREALREAARRVDIERSTVINAPAAATGLQEQETQILGGGTRARAADATLLEDAGDAAPSVAASAKGTNLSPSARVTSFDGAPRTAVAAPVNADSVVTRVSPAENLPPRGRALSTRTLGAAASVVVLLIVAGAFYAYNRRDDSPKPAPALQEQPAAQTGDTVQPESSQTPAPEESVQPAASVASGEPATEQPKQPSGKSTKRRSSSEREPDEADEEDEGPHAPGGVHPVPPPPGYGLPPEEQERLRRLPRRIRRIVIEEQRRNAERQRVLEEQRRRRQQQQPYPPE